MSFQNRLSALISAMRGDFDTLDSRIAALEAAGGGGGSSVGAPIAIWAEENGGLAANTAEWSWGNGAVGNAIGIPIAVDAELVAMSFNAESFGAGASIRTRGNGVLLHEASFTTNNSVVDITPVPVAKGTRIDFQTGTIFGGSVNDARVCAWFREVV